MSRICRRWTDDEIALAVDRHVSHSEAAALLGRTERAVSTMAYRIRKGWMPQLESWTEADVDYVRSTPHLTAERVAADLGRSYGAVTAKRWRLRVSEGIDFGTGLAVNKSPYNHGRRRVLAKTCLGCGLLLDGRFFADRGTHTSRCGACRRGMRSDELNERERGRGVEWATAQEATAERLAPSSMPYKSRHFAEYTEWDHRILADPDLTSIEKAVRLGRTVKAVSSAMSKFGYTENRALGNPEDGVWHIAFPAALVAS